MKAWSDLFKKITNIFKVYRFTKAGLNESLSRNRILRVIFLTFIHLLNTRNKFQVFHKRWIKISENQHTSSAIYKVQGCVNHLLMHFKSAILYFAFKWKGEDNKFIYYYLKVEWRVVLYIFFLFKSKKKTFLTCQTYVAGHLLCSWFWSYLYIRILFHVVITRHSKNNNNRERVSV